MNDSSIGKRLLLPFFIMVTVLATLTGVANAGVGILEEDEQLVSVNLSLSGSNEHWDVNRNVITSVCKRRNGSLNFSYEYGWSYFHTVFSSLNFAHRRCGQTSIPGGGGLLVSGKATGVGDAEIGIRTRFSGNYMNNAAWETFMIIPTGYDNDSPSALGRGALGLGFGVSLSSDASHRYPNKWGLSPSKWGWKVGSKFTYFFSGKGNSLSSFAALQYAFTGSDFEQTGDFVEFRIDNSIGFARGGVQNQVFVNQVQTSMTSSDSTSFKIKYSHSFENGWSGSLSFGKAFFGRNAPISYNFGAGASYRWRD